VIETALFVAIVALSLSSGQLPLPVPTKVGIGFGLLLATGCLLLAESIRLFVPALFFAIHATLSPLVLLGLSRLAFEYPQLYLLPSIAIYLIIVLSVPSLRRQVQWLHWGRLTRGTIVSGIVIVAGSALALVGWALLIAEDLSIFLDYVPDVPLGVLVIYGLAFTVTNPLVEEFLARAVLFDGFAALTQRMAIVIAAQAVVFAIWHFEGFPGGPVGSSMVLAWSIFLGLLRHLSGGMLAPLLVHFFADLTIALIILFVLILAQSDHETLRAMYPRF
jgi:membrane protease YdiL (CAAX protease family)